MGNMKAFFGCLVFLLWFVGGVNGDPVAVRSQPNILFILADDLAWSDPGYAGHAWHETPHLDALAASGMVFTDAYAAAPICSASRASILTGKTTARLGFEFVTKNEPGFQKIDMVTPLKAPAFTLNLPLVEETIAEALSNLGYQTAFFGKWHLNAHYKKYLGWSPTHGPIQQGFEIAVENFGNHPYAWGKETPEPINDPGVFPKDSMVDAVCHFLEQDHEVPFFAMASSFYVHTPVRTPCRWLLEKYGAKIPRESPNRDKRIAYASFLETLDHHVGRMLKALDASGQRENTLVVFTSDNGGHPEFTANGPLRGSKWNLYEGGIRVPFIAHWPGHTVAGSQSQLPVIGYDLLPTFVEVAGGDAPNVDGVSLVPHVNDPRRFMDRGLIWHFPYYHPEKGYAKAIESVGLNDFEVSKTHPQSALRRGHYKLVYFYENERSELFDLQKDVSEQTDISGMFPELADSLTSDLMRELRGMNARFPGR